MKNTLKILLTLSVIITCSKTSSQKNSDPVVNWALKNSQKIKTVELTENQNDLNLLGRIVGNAEVVCLGESRHDIHQQFKIKHRFIKYLVQEMDFTTFVLEASFPYSKIINDYLLYGQGNLDNIMLDMPGWFLWDTHEMEEIFKWLREFNENHNKDEKVKFYGIDIVAPNYALDQIFKYLQKTDKPYYDKIKNRNFARDIINDNNWPVSLQRYSELSGKEKRILSDNYKNLMQHIKQNKNRYISRSSEVEYDWILELSYCANEANTMFSEEDRFKVGLIRDNAMANIALWIKERNRKIIIWAHNVHIAKSEFTMNMFPDTPIKGMGYILNQELKDKMISIGASFNQGEFQNESRIFGPAGSGTIDGTLARLNMNYFILNLKSKSANSEVEKWLNTRNNLRGQDFEMTCVPVKSFDAMYFTDKISKVNYNPETLRKITN